MVDIYELLATEKQCQGDLMVKRSDGSCAYCVEGLIARTSTFLNMNMIQSILQGAMPLEILVLIV